MEVNRRGLLIGATALTSLGAVTVGGGTALAQQARPTAPKMGEVLPIAAPRQPPITEPDWRKVPQPEPFIVRPPKGAPNVLLILLDQIAYADPSTFGGPIKFPTLDRLAKEGLTYTNFHVNSLCSPSRTCPVDRSQPAPEQPGRGGRRCDFLSRRYGHAPARASRRSRKFCASGATVRRCSARATRRRRGRRASAARSTAGRRDQGFEKFYGFLGGEKSLFRPYLVDGTT